jgi:NTE family protein
LITSAHVDAIFGEHFAQTPLDKSPADLHLRAWLASLEEHHQYILYAGDNDHDPWSLRCLHQADRILVLAEAARLPESVPVLDALHTNGLIVPIELVLLRSEGDPSPHTLAWREETGARAHYFIHPWAHNDISALARQISGQGVGLVLGGGGARGFAHIGLIRALEQLQIPIDIVGGTSMGAFVAALVACGFDSVEMSHIAQETFVARNYLNDYNVPKFSLIRGARFHNRLLSVFGHRRIEELRRTFYCISTNLTTGNPMIHDRGTLATWVGTSMSVPGVVPPVAWHGDLLCDGGVVNNLPTDVMHSLERGIIIASNVSMNGDIGAPGAGIEEPDQLALLNWKSEKRAPSLSEILMRTATLASDNTIQLSSISNADVYLRMPIEDIGMFDWERLDELIERGYQYGLEQLTPIRDTLPR